MEINVGVRSLGFCVCFFNELFVTFYLRNVTHSNKQNKQNNNSRVFYSSKTKKEFTFRLLSLPFSNTSIVYGILFGNFRKERPPAPFSYYEPWKDLLLQREVIRPTRRRATNKTIVSKF